MKSPIQKPTFKIALCAIIAALAAALMLMTSLIPVGTCALPCFAGAFLIAIVVEYGAKWALGVYAVVSVLSFFIAGDREAVLYFALFFGYYPVLKAFIEGRLKSRLIQYVFKFAVFNAAAVGSFFIATKLLAVPAEEFTLFGIYMPLVFLAFGNLFFLLYDFALTSFVMIYVRKIREKLLHIFK